jgi:hypothetical protein
MLLEDGRPDAAAERLGPVYATFREGSETADVREAGELLAAIAAGPLAGT